MRELDPGARLEDFNALSAGEAEAVLLPCCASRAWAAAVAGGRPYATGEELVAAGEKRAAELGRQDVGEALAAHPRIGERSSGSDREATWSRGEQAGARDAGEAILEALRQGNEAYEKRFGHVYLICATGRSAPEMLDILRARLGNDEETERAIVREELAKITGLRLAKLLRGETGERAGA